jgi:transposase
MRRILTNPIWDLLEPLLRAAKKSRVGAKPKLCDREFLEALLWIDRTGCPWRDLHEDFGDWNAVYQRFKRWKDNGLFDRLFDALPADSALGGVRRLFVDSTTSRAHPHAAGAQKKFRPTTKASAARGAGSARKST